MNEDITGGHNVPGIFSHECILALHAAAAPVLPLAGRCLGSGAHLAQVGPALGKEGLQLGMSTIRSFFERMVRFFPEPP